MSNVAHALLRAALALVPTQGLRSNGCREESRQGTQERAMSLSLSCRKNFKGLMSLAEHPGIGEPGVGTIADAARRSACAKMDSTLRRVSQNPVTLRRSA